MMQKLKIAFAIVAIFLSCSLQAANKITSSKTASNHIDAVDKCLKKAKKDLTALRTCVEEKKVITVPSAEIGSTPQSHFTMQSWQIDKMVDYDESRRFSHQFESPDKDHWFCGYRAEEKKKTNASWSVYDINGKGAFVVGVLKGKGEVSDQHPAVLTLDVQARWLAKNAAGHLTADLFCEGEGWSLKPVPNELATHLQPKLCVNYVMVCSTHNISGKEGKWQVCGLCEAQNKEFL